MVGSSERALNESEGMRYLPILHVSMQSLYFFKRKNTEALREYPFAHVGLKSTVFSASARALERSPAPREAAERFE